MPAIFPARTTTWCLIGLLVAAAGLRLAVVAQRLPQLTEDRDGYLALADSLTSGEGFVSQETGRPTAYRPPLYPLLIAALRVFGDGPWVLGVAHAVIGTVIVGLTFALGSRLLGTWPGILAAVLVAVDPLLLQYTAQAMTETVFTGLTTGLLVLAVAGPSETWSVRRQIALGTLLGLAALCRPTVWAWPALLTAWCIAAAWRSTGARRAMERAWHMRWAAMAAFVVVLPWIVRNAIVLGSPVATTTHGGYTLLLANNPVLYREEVEKPWSVTWEDAPAGSRQSDWYADLLRQRNDALGPNADEIASDRWMSARARQHIRDEPITFGKAMWLRVRRLWNVAPLGAASRRYPPWVGGVVGGWYTLLFASALVGIVRVSRPSARKGLDVAASQVDAKSGKSDPQGWWPPLFLLLLSVTLVHSVYWSNARMRAPLMPAVCVLAGAVLRRPQT